MEEELISFKTAKLAKECGCELKGDYLYIGDRDIDLITNIGTISKIYWHALTQSLLQKWLRDVYHIDVLVFHKHRLKGTTWTSEVHFNDHLRYTNHDYENDYTYEEALEQGLQEALKLI